VKFVIFGLSITSSWGNGHATTYRSLVKALCRRGHEVLFLERDAPWYAENRDMPKPPFGRTVLYRRLGELKKVHLNAVRTADVVIVGSYVPEGIEIGRWVTRTASGITAFYDIDTPITLAGLCAGGTSYLSRELVPAYALYLSFTGGPTLERLERTFGSPCARPLYCSVDESLYQPEPSCLAWSLGYLGTYSDDRQPALDELLVGPARALREARFVVAGPQYPDTLEWPSNVERTPHVAPSEHRSFYGRQRFTLNVTRGEMIRAGYSPSVRLFEAAACGTPIISDAWSGLETFLEPGREILVARTGRDVESYLHDMSDAERLDVAERARARILANHTAECRAAELEGFVLTARHGHGNTHDATREPRVNLA
jgi:spore maturation protein CgeB